MEDKHREALNTVFGPMHDVEQVINELLLWLRMHIFDSHLSFSSMFPLEVIDKARINSSNSIAPSFIDI